MKSLPIKVVGVFVSLWLLNLYGLPKGPYQIGLCISELMGGMGDENKNKAGLPDKRVMGFFCFAGKALIKYQYPSIEKETIL